MNKKIGWKSLRLINGQIKSGNGDCSWEIGEWKKERGIKLCKKGFHASKLINDAMSYCSCEIISLVEYKGEALEDSDKFVAEEMRLVKAYHWRKKDSLNASVFFVEQAMKNVDKKKDEEVYNACIGSIKAVKLMLKAKTKEEIAKAASAAESAQSAAESVAESAAWSAKSTAWSAKSAAQSTAWSAKSAQSAAESVAESVAESAAWSAQSAEFAAKSAKSAAKSAKSAAWSAESAQSTAWSADFAAKSAQSAKNLQHKWLKRYIEKNCKKVKTSL